MNYQRLTLLCFFCLLAQISLANSSCADAYTSASYGLSHSKKSLKAYNFDHQRYYAGRALEALEKTRDLVGDCGCDGALEAIAEGIDNLEKALDPEDWDMGRYFSKRAIADAYTVLENLDVCSSENAINNSSDQAELERPADNTAINSSEHSADQIAMAKTVDQEAAQKLSQLRQDLEELTTLLAGKNGKTASETWPDAAEWAGSFSNPDAIRDHYAQETRKLYQRALKVLEACREE